MLDLEGTLYTRAGVIPGARETVAALRKCTAGIRFLTNTDSRADGSLLAELHELDLDVAEHELFTPVTAAAKLVSAVPGARAFVIGTSEVTEQLADTLQLAADPTAATHVIVGDCRTSLSYSLLNDAFQALSNGAELIALQHGRYFLSGGRAQLDTGAVVAALEYATDRTAVVVGKPSVHFLDAAVRSFPGTPAPEDVWVVGDDAATDIAMGQHYGATTVQVRTGKFDPAHQTAYATHIIDSITGLLALLRK
ncbi:MAG: HAD-IIA family hydrolase [Propionibacteriaceae bacterium]|nr:HAD-IIA family hydrolase [Propionibacteriaceae bacterium]